MTTAQEERNTAFVLEALDTLFNRKDYNRAAQFWADDYIQHSRHVPAGRDGLFGLVASMPGLRFEYDRVAANGDAANKIGTYALAVLAKEHEVPFFVEAGTLLGAYRGGDVIPGDQDVDLGVVRW